jgi:hypothetical protein
MASLTFFIIVAWWQGLCWHGSLPGFLGKWGREREKQNAGESSSFFPCSLRVPGKKKANGAVQNDTVCLFLFFFKQCTKRRRLTQNALFHLKGNGAKMFQIQN